MISRSPCLASRPPAFLAGLEQSAMHAVVDAAEFRWIPATQAITTGGNPATHLLLLQRGSARYCHLTKKGELVVLAHLVAGDVIGLMTLLKTPSAYIASAEAA